MTGTRGILTFGMIGGLLALAWVSPLRAQPEERPPQRSFLLKPTGLPDGDSPEAILPAGAVAHLRLKSAQLLLDNVSTMAKKFVPAEALPPPLAKALDEPNALLALIGMQTMGAPLSVEMLAKISGVDPARPVSLSLYMGPPDQAFILQIPVRDLAAISALISRLAGPAKPEEVKLPGGTAYHLKIKGANLVLVCNEKTLCVCGAPQLAAALLSAPKGQRLDSSEFIGRVLKQHAGDNLVLIVDATPVKPMLPMLQRYSAIPEPAIARLRAEMLRGARPRDLAMFNSQLQKRLGVRDVQQFMDYVECLATGTYEVLAESLLNQAQQFDGLSLSLNFSADYQRVNFSVYSKAITAAAARRPLPLADVGRALASVPGSHNALVLSGQSQPAAKVELLANILERVSAKMKAKQLPPALCDELQKAYAAYQPSQDIESKVPWTISTSTAQAGGDSAAPESLQAYLTNLNTHMVTADIVAFPRQKEGFLAEYFAGETKVNNADNQLVRHLMEAAGVEPPSYTWESRLATVPMSDGVTRFVQESSYTTHWGLFGNNEHELINRRFTLARDVGDLTLLWPGGRDAKAMAGLKAQPTLAAIRRLLVETHVPKDANRIEVLRVLHLVNSITDTLAEIEGLIHKDATGYLAAVEAVRKQPGAEREVMARLAAIKVPVEVFELKMSPQGEFYVTCPGGITFPRPKLMPEVQGLFKEFREAADQQGGMVVYERTQDGQYEVTLVQSTEALATLVRTVGNNVVRRYLRDPEGMATLRTLVRTPLDMTSMRDQTILINTTWDFLPSPGRRPPAVPEIPEE